MSGSADDLRRTIEAELRPDETLIWIGQPDPAQFSREVRRACLCQLGLIALVIAAAVWVISYLSAPGNARVAAIVLVAGMIGYFMIAAPWRYPLRVLQSIYAITDRRALVYHGVGWSSLWFDAIPDLHDPLWSFDGNQIRARRKILRYGTRTDLVFEGERHSYWTGRGQIVDWVHVGFLGLADVDEVDQLLEARFAPAGGVSSTFHP